MIKESERMARLNLEFFLQLILSQILLQDFTSKKKTARYFFRENTKKIAFKKKQKFILYRADLASTSLTYELYKLYKGLML